MSEKIQLIAEQASHNLQRLIQEASEEISTAMVHAASEAQLQEKEAVFNLGFQVKLNLDTNKATHTLSWSVKHKLEVEDEIPDPNQLKLPIEDKTEVSVQFGEGKDAKEIKMGKDFVKNCNKALKKMRGK